MEPFPPRLQTARLATAGACLLACLSGCALPQSRPAAPGTGPTPETQAAWEMHRASLSVLRDWTLKGRIAVQTEDDGWHGGLYWKQAGDDYRLRFNAPLGQGSIEVYSVADGVELRTSKKRSRHARTPEGLMQQDLGWHLPVTGMRYWIKGTPAPGGNVGSMELDGDGRLHRLEQSGWRVEFSDYRESGLFWLPASIAFENGDVRVRIRVTRWEPDA